MSKRELFRNTIKLRTNKGAQVHLAPEALDEAWLREAEDRLMAYRAGEVDAIDAEQVFAELGRKIRK